MSRCTSKCVFFSQLLAVLIQMQLRFLTMEQGLMKLDLRPRGQEQLEVIQLAQISPRYASF